MQREWPDNRTVTIVCHGHSVPAGYFATPVVDTFNAYPHLLHRELKSRFPCAVINVVVTAIGGEDSPAGAQRFAQDVLTHRPHLITIDYGLNDRRAGVEAAEAAWCSMIESGIASGAKVILLTPTGDTTLLPDFQGEEKGALVAHANQIRRIAARYGVGLADSFRWFQEAATLGELDDLLSWPNHPNRRGHDLVVRELMRWFPEG
ncbi:MAG: SGNH/GDSL hydrolase family protein [Spirochaetales bacterium]|nr:MAG: SGNH/GDSL hydrolase family protein [Spirochaetales bacterium]